MSRTRELKPFLDKNKFECRPDAIDSHFKFLRLMEQFGLSRVENERSLQAQLNSMHWRVKQDNGSMIIEIISSHLTIHYLVTETYVSFSDSEGGKKSSKKAKHFGYFHYKIIDLCIFLHHCIRFRCRRAG